MSDRERIAQVAQMLSEPLESYTLRILTSESLPLESNTLRILTSESLPLESLLIKSSPLDHHFKNNKFPNHYLSKKQCLKGTLSRYVRPPFFAHSLVRILHDFTHTGSLR